MGESHDRGRPGRGDVHIIVVPGNGGQTINLTWPRWVFNVALGGVAALVVMLAGSFIVTAKMGAELKRLQAVEEENTELLAERQRMRQLEQEMTRLDDLRRRVLSLANAGVGTEIEIAEMPAASVAAGPGAGSAAGSGSPASSGDTGEPGDVQLAARTRLPRARWPVEGVLSRTYEIDSTPDREHHGIDIAAPQGTPVCAAWAGVVSFAGRDSVFGQLVIIDHGGGMESLYGHNSSILVGQGDWVRDGQEIARVGSTGESSAPHVHFEIRNAGKSVDPRPFLMR
jgi:murein DD-endopeptidase MepM/ murein hydrolase activator NlpD